MITRFFAWIVIGILSIVFEIIRRALQPLFRAIDRLVFPVVVVATLILWAIVGISYL